MRCVKWPGRIKLEISPLGIYSVGVALEVGKKFEMV